MPVFTQPKTTLYLTEKNCAFHRRLRIVRIIIYKNLDSFYFIGGARNRVMHELKSDFGFCLGLSYKNITQQPVSTPTFLPCGITQPQ